MDELKFVIKCFLFSCALFVLSQLQMQGLTIESRVHSYLVSSPVANFVNETAYGGAKLTVKYWNMAMNELNFKNLIYKPSSAIETKRAFRSPVVQKNKTITDDLEVEDQVEHVKSEDILL